MSDHTIHTPAPRVARYEYDRVPFVDPHPGKDDSEVVGYTTCGRCGGTGHMPYTLDGGRCWGECNGNPAWRAPVTVGHERHLARLVVKNENQHRRDDAKSKHYWNHFVNTVAAQYPQWARLPQMDSPFVTGLVAQVRRGRQLSDKQVIAGAEAIDRYLTQGARQAEQEAAKAALPPLEEGRYTLVGKVVSTKLQESQYGSTWKMLLELASGQRVWGTVANTLFDKDGRLPAEGTKVQLTATVKRSDDDHTFGFYSRPSKASRLAE